MILDLRTESEGRITITKIGPRLAFSTAHVMHPTPEPITLTKPEAGKVWAALGKALRDPQA